MFAHGSLGLVAPLRGPLDLGEKEKTRQRKKERGREREREREKRQTKSEQRANRKDKGER